MKYPKSNFIKDSFFNTEFHEMMDKQREISTFNRKISKSQTHLRKQHEHELNKLILFTNQKREYKNCQKDKTISFTTYANQQSIQQKVSSKVIFNLQKLCYLTLKLWIQSSQEIKNKIQSFKIQLFLKTQSFTK